MERGALLPQGSAGGLTRVHGAADRALSDHAVSDSKCHSSSWPTLHGQAGAGGGQGLGLPGWGSPGKPPVRRETPTPTPHGQQADVRAHKCPRYEPMAQRHGEGLPTPTTFEVFSSFCGGILGPRQVCLFWAADRILERTLGLKVPVPPRKWVLRPCGPATARTGPGQGSASEAGSRGRVQPQREARCAANDKTRNRGPSTLPVVSAPHGPLAGSHRQTHSTCVWATRI